ncbi:hypothetical protein Rcae01_00668 [Novipirellula caenicola]|uniref:Transposase DDE domain-containing protein n=1 Tax=Novipirellula caenicola TaxID=1536901 RepID=A0ABP9VKB1_9BACT
MTQRRGSLDSCFHHINQTLDSRRAGRWDGKEKIQIAGHSAVSHLFALHVFVLFKTNACLDNNMPQLDRIVFPRRPLSAVPQIGKKMEGKNMSEHRTILRYPMFLPPSFSCPIL